MKTLAFESSAKTASVALLEDDVPVAVFTQNSGLTHSKTLLKLAENLLQNTQTRFSDVDLFAVANGPGSFTGIRIGVSLVKGLAFALDKPCIGVSTLEAMAYTLPKQEAYVCAVMDARVKQVYNAIFDLQSASPVRICEDRAISLDTLQQHLQKLERPVVFIGDGSELCAAAFKMPEALLPPHMRYQNAYGVGRLAVNTFCSQAAETDPAKLVPHYLRLPQAERERLQRMV